LKPVEGNSFHSLLKRYYLDIETVVIRKSVLEKNDLKFHDNLDYTSDAHLFIKVAYFSKTAYSPHILAKWRIHENQQSYLYYEGFLKEFKYMLDDIEKIIDIKDKVNLNAITKARITVSLKMTYFYWGKENSAKARNIIKLIPSWDYRCFIIFNLTYLVPFKIIQSIVNIIR
jgi:hypothetical protein